jgi:hypothetical protein
LAETVVAPLSAALVLSVRPLQPAPAARTGGFYDKTTRGIRIFIAAPRLRGVLALHLSVAAAGAVVIVNTVVIVQGLLGRIDTDRQPWVMIPEAVTIVAPDSSPILLMLHRKAVSTGDSASQRIKEVGSSLAHRVRG